MLTPVMVPASSAHGATAKANASIAKVPASAKPAAAPAKCRPYTSYIFFQRTPGRWDCDNHNGK